MKRRRRTICDCGDQIIWTVTVNGKNMPVNADPELNGNVYLDDLPNGKVRSTVVPTGKATILRAAGQPLHLSHFASCPRADKHRKGHR